MRERRADREGRPREAVLVHLDVILVTFEVKSVRLKFKVTGGKVPFSAMGACYQDVYILNRQTAAPNMHTTHGLKRIIGGLLVEFSAIKWSVRPRVRAF